MRHLALFLALLSVASAHPGPRPDGKHGKDDPVEFDDGLDNQGHNNGSSPNLCSTLCDFPITDLNVTEMNYVPVGRFKVDPAPLTFWLNYTCPEGIEMVDRLRIGARHGLSHLRWEHVNSSDLTGGFKVNLWGTFELVDKVSNWTVGVRQKNCAQPPVSFQFSTTNPLGLTPPPVKSDDRLSNTNCTDGASGVQTISVDALDGDEIAVELNSSIPLDVTVLQVGYELEDDEKPKEKREKKKGKVDQKAQDWSGEFKPLDLPANISMATEHKDNKTRVRVKVGKGQRNATGLVCVALNISDGISATDKTQFLALNLTPGSTNGGSSTRSIWGTGFMLLGVLMML